ncbi:helix-turn-helix transcriptional regulator [Spirosoma sp. KNUC1025]|uniref:helix-turn-helix transcriptional regulator n=1 Tax=Spirosoma sp. KNUC1025 TaxID=2894082 RepID=UPI00386D30D4|nr:AraC family transcriptional regulator [Spirosoma sp. KNUC1025]
MQITSTNYGYYFDQFERSYPAEFHDRTGYTETHTRLNDDVSKGELGEICFQGVRIHYGRFHTLKTDAIHTTENFSSVEMTFQVQGQMSQQSSVSIQLCDQQHNLNYRPYGDGKSWFGTGSHFYVGVQLTETFFNRFADDTSPRMSHLLNSIAQRNATTLVSHNLPIGPALQAQLTQLTQASRTQPFKRLYLETIVLDLLRQQLEQADTDRANRETALSVSDIDKIMAVKTWLDTHPLDNHSLLQLCRYAGLNDYKLKKGFRELIGTTVFGYLNDLRMQYAHQLLRDTNQPIGDIALTLGYSETHHFSAAFKRKFGYLPSQLNRRSTFGS